MLNLSIPILFPSSSSCFSLCTPNTIPYSQAEVAAQVQVVRKTHLPHIIHQNEEAIWNEDYPSHMLPEHLSLIVSFLVKEHGSFPYHTALTLTARRICLSHSIPSILI